MSTQQVNEVRDLSDSGMVDAREPDLTMLAAGSQTFATETSSHRGRSYARCCCVATTAAAVAVGVTAVALHYFQPALLGDFNSYFPQ